MSRRPNRIVLALLGLVLVAGGALVLLAAYGILPVAEPGALYDDLAAAAEAHPEQWAGGVALGGLLAAALGAWLVRRQLRVRRGGRLGTVTLAREARGRTTLEAASVGRAAAADLRRGRGVVSTHVRMVTYGPRPRLLVALAIDTDTDPRAALGGAEDVYQRICGLLGTPDLHVDTVVRPTAKPGDRVR